MGYFGPTFCRFDFFSSKLTTCFLLFSIPALLASTTGTRSSDEPVIFSTNFEFSTFWGLGLGAWGLGLGAWGLGLGAWGLGLGGLLFRNLISGKLAVCVNKVF
jgi:hypothetical protein